ncbi:ABC transporter ATP-binding protein [Acidisoma sp. 7E03]
MLEVSGLSVTLGGRPILRDLGFVAPAGSITAVLGRNGAGKTSLIRALAGLIPMEGEVRLAGQSLAALSPAARGSAIGYMAQELAATTARLSVLDLLVLAQNTHQLGWRPRAQSLAMAEAILADLGLTAHAGAMPLHLSGGQRQMVALALALVRRPRLLLLDEPTSALDITNQLHLLNFVRDYTRRHAIVTVMILHDLNLVTRFAERALLLDGGRLAAAGAMPDVLDRERLAETYGIDCQILELPSGHRVIYALGAASSTGS